MESDQDVTLSVGVGIALHSASLTRFLMAKLMDFDVKKFGHTVGAG